jgi:hypothetical protein
MERGAKCSVEAKEKAGGRTIPHESIKINRACKNFVCTAIVYPISPYLLDEKSFVKKSEKMLLSPSAIILTDRPLAAFIYLQRLNGLKM